MGSTTKSGRFADSPQAKKLSDAKIKADEAAAYVERRMNKRIDAMKAALAGDDAPEDDTPTGRYASIGFDPFPAH